MTDRQKLGAALVSGGVILLVVGLFLLMSSPGGAEPGTSPSASAVLSGSAEPSPTPTPSPTPSPTPTPIPTPTPLGEEAVRAFAAELAGWVRAGDAAALLATLHPAVIDRYGEPGCAEQVAAFVDPTYALVVDAVGDPAPWDYASDGLTTTIADAWTVSADRTANGTTSAAELHFAPADGTVRWFTDCGEPL